MYKDYYQLKILPFNMSPDPRFFYASKGHNRALSYLQYGLTQGEGFIVITGDIGTGKTTIVKNLLKQLDPGTFIAKQLVTTYLQESDLIEMVCESFGLPSKGLSKATLLNQLNSFLTQSYRQNKRIVLIVDEVQNLPIKTVEELRMLSNFQIDNKPLIQSFLVGQKEFIPTLQSENMEQLRQRVIASSHLGPLKEEETKNYINYRLKQAGWSGSELFNRNAFLLIHELTEGVPRRINVFCDRILLFGYLEDIRYFTEGHINLVADELADEITSPVKKNKYIEESSIALCSDVNFQNDITDTTQSTSPPVEINTEKEHQQTDSKQNSEKKHYSEKKVKKGLNNHEASWIEHESSINHQFAPPNYNVSHNNELVSSKYNVLDLNKKTIEKRLPNDETGVREDITQQLSGFQTTTCHSITNSGNEEAKNRKTKSGDMFDEAMIELDDFSNEMEKRLNDFMKKLDRKL